MRTWRKSIELCKYSWVVRYGHKIGPKWAKFLTFSDHILVKNYWNLICKIPEFGANLTHFWAKYDISEIQTNGLSLCLSPNTAFVCQFCCQLVIYRIQVVLKNANIIIKPFTCITSTYCNGSFIRHWLRQWVQALLLSRKENYCRKESVLPIISLIHWSTIVLYNLLYTVRISF